MAITFVGFVIMFISLSIGFWLGHPLSITPGFGLLMGILLFGCIMLVVLLPHLNTK